MSAPTGTSTKPRLPAGLRWSDVWRAEDGTLVEGTVEVPVNQDRRIAGHLYVCPAADCDVEEWMFGAQDEPPCCRRHPVRLIRDRADPSNPDPTAAAHGRVRDRVRAAMAHKRDQAIEAAAERARLAQQAIADAGRRQAKEMRGHVPSLIATGAVLVTGGALGAADPVVATVAGGVVMSFGAVLAYAAVYLVERLKARRVGAGLVGRAGKRVRTRARLIALAVFCAGVWSVTASLLGVDPSTIPGAVSWLVGALLAWIANRSHWDRLWADRRRLRLLAQQRVAEAAERARQEAERIAAEQEKARRAKAVVDESPAAVGARMAERWARIAKSDTVPIGFAMARTRIVPEETHSVTVPNEDGQQVHVAWEFSIAADPGVLVARAGMVAPLLGARDWLASMLEIDPAQLSLVDRPEGQVNKGLMMVTDPGRRSVGEVVRWKGKAGIRVGSDGALYGHAGRTILGEDVEKALWIPGQPGGGGRYGITGAGKSVMTQISILNDLAAGIFTTLYDPKNLVDFAEFVGVIPLGVTREHRDVLWRSHWAEMRRRQAYLTKLSGKDRHGRPAPLDPTWNIRRDGPPIRSIWEEFHMEADDPDFIARLTKMVRLQRATALMVEVATQGGGLADMGDSNLRTNLNQVSMELTRMDNHQTMLTGYKGTYMPSELPRLPGMMLLVAPGAPVVPMRSAYVHRRDEDGSIFDQLFAPDMTPLLAPPALSAETERVYRTEGLMDLWELGKGPNGRANLLDQAATPVPAIAAGVSPGPTGPALAALPCADVILALAYTQPGCPRATLDTSPEWMNRAGWGAPPNPSTISRAAKSLAAEGLITRDNGEYRVTDKGMERAKLAVAMMLLAGDRSATSVPDPEAENEREDEFDPDGPLTEAQLARMS